jgi:hypothetical protein
MKTLRFDRPHFVLSAALLVLVTLAGFVSHASTKAVERSIIASAADLLESRSTNNQWDFLRTGMVLGRIVTEDDAVYVFTVRLFGGDTRYAVILDENGRPKSFSDLGTGPVSPHALRIAKVMKAHAGVPLEDSSALDPLIAHTIMANIQTIALYERTRKEAAGGQ